MADTKFRYSGAIPIAGVVALLGAVPLATAGFGDPSPGTPAWAYPLLLLLLIPIAVIVWGARAGTDVNSTRLRVRRNGLTSECYSWADVTGIVPQQRKVYAILQDERAVPLPAVTRERIDRLIAASGQELATDADPEPTTAQ